MLKPYQQRVVSEKEELDQRLAQLKAFVQENPIFRNLPVDERARLMFQQHVMQEYSNILAERIGAF